MWKCLETYVWQCLQITFLEFFYVAYSIAINQCIPSCLSSVQKDVIQKKERPLRVVWQQFERSKGAHCELNRLVLPKWKTWTCKTTDKKRLKKKKWHLKSLKNHAEHLTGFKKGIIHSLSRYSDLGGWESVLQYISSVNNITL